MFTDDGLKARDIEHVGARAPDTDPPDAGPPPRPDAPGRVEER